MCTFLKCVVHFIWSTGIYRLCMFVEPVLLFWYAFHRCLLTFIMDDISKSGHVTSCLWDLTCSIVAPTTLIFPLQDPNPIRTKPKKERNSRESRFWPPNRSPIVNGISERAAHWVYILSERCPVFCQHRLDLLTPHIVVGTLHQSHPETLRRRSQSTRSFQD